MCTVLKVDGWRTYIHSIVELTKELTRVTGVVGRLLHNHVLDTAHIAPTPTENAEERKLLGTLVGGKICVHSFADPSIIVKYNWKGS